MFMLDGQKQNNKSMRVASMITRISGNFDERNPNADMKSLIFS